MDSRWGEGLRVGDRVLALDAHGELIFSEVILWLDRRPSAVERYVLLTTEDYSEQLSLSADHVTFIAPSNRTAATFSTMIPVFAKDLQPGHLIHRYDPATGSLVSRRVTNVQETKDLGAFAPLTVEGNLIVDGHLVSCYALQCRQYLAHLPFAPYRFLHTLQQEDEGMHWYARAWYQVGQWFNYPFGKTCYPRELHLYHYP
uniref:Hedgehog protein Hint domain-containing protein n=1 Tax=Pygocentrus nattereri TaxID=42514 RepID=A0A3B4E4V2_PYGNA